MRLRFGCRLSYTVEADTPFVFNIEAPSGPGRAVSGERLVLDPALETERWTMPESDNRYLRVVAPAGDLSVEYEAQVEADPVLEAADAVTELAARDLPLSVLAHLFPSRYCQSDRLERFARSTFGALQPGYARVNGVCNWIRDNVSYEGGVSDAMTSAFDTVTQRAGVCRDFAHLGIALCRALGIPARYVSAYACGLQPPDFHAVFEAWLAGPGGGGWYVFDPTRLADPAGLVRIGIGRDAAEVSFCTPFGPVRFGTPEVWVQAQGPVEQAGVRAVRSGER